MKALRLAFCVSGRGMLFRAAVRWKARCSIEPVLLIAEQKAAADLEVFTADNGVPMVRLDASNRASFDDAVGRHCLEARPDLVALTFDRILKPQLVAAYRHRIINVHPALLPSFPGLNAARRTLESNALVGGASIHEVTDDVDGGPLIAQVVVPLIPGESTETYGRRMYRLLEPTFLQTLRWFAEERVVAEERGSIRVRDAQYGSLPVIPALESFAPAAR